MASSRPQEQYATTPCWLQLDEILRDRLAWLHHSIGRNVLSPDEGAEQFSHIVGDLLLEYQVIALPSGNGRHRPRRLETTLENLSAMKNRAPAGICKVTREIL